MNRNILKSIFFAKKPLHLILHVTNRCNLRCKTCFVGFDNDDKVELSLTEIRELTGYLDEIVWLDIGGGEPFLRSDLFDICVAFSAKSLTIPTNGFNPSLIYETTRKIRNSVAAEMIISVSIDGFEETNDIIRSKGCFKKSLETLNLLKTLTGIKIKVNTVLCEKNYDEIIDFMRFIKGRGVDFHSIIFQRGVPRDIGFICPSFEKLDRIKKDIFTMWNEYDYGMPFLQAKILKGYQKMMYNTSLKVIKEKKQIFQCLAGKFHLVIYSNGDVSFCEMLKPFGNVRIGKLDVLLKSEKAQELRRFIAEKKCYCYHNCNMLDNFFLNPLQYPKLLANLLK